MTTPIRCPKGHWYTPGNPDKPGVCPTCSAKLREQHNKPLSDDDVLAILEDTNVPLKVAIPETEDETPELKSASHPHTLQLRKKVCPNCHYETSFSFAICPRCAGPLKIVEIEVL